MDVEAENFGREGVLYREFFSPPDALLPRSFGHPAIMGLLVSASNCASFRLHFSGRLWLTVTEVRDYIP